MPKFINIPVASDLVALGNPKLKNQANRNHAAPSHIEELNNRIDELEKAIGQDTSGPIGRAFAIRAEVDHDKEDTNTSAENFYHIEEKTA